MKIKPRLMVKFSMPLNKVALNRVRHLWNGVRNAFSKALITAGPSPVAIKGHSYRLLLTLLLLFLLCAGCASIPKNDSHSLCEKSHIGTDRFAVVNGYNIHYVEAGVGKPIVLIPGAFSTYRVWNRLIPQLAQNFRVIAIDYVGVGDSDKPEEDFDYSVKSQADIIAEIIRTMNLGKVRLAGVSYGSAIALNIAGRYPHLVENVICIEGGALIAPEQLNHSKTAALLGIPIIGDMFHAALRTGLFDKTAARDVMGTAWNKLDMSEQEEIIGIISLNIRTSSRMAWYHIYRSITSPVDFTDTIKNSPVPMRYLYGEQSRYREVSKVNAEIISRIAPRAEVIAIDDGIHDLELQYPDKVLDAITKPWGQNELSAGLLTERND